MPPYSQSLVRKPHVAEASDHASGQGGRKEHPPRASCRIAGQLVAEEPDVRRGQESAMIVEYAPDRPPRQSRSQAAPGLPIGADRNTIQHGGRDGALVPYRYADDMDRASLVASEPVIGCRAPLSIEY